MDSFDTIARYLPVEIRSPKGGGGHGGHGSSGGSSGGSSKGSSGSSSSGSSSKGSSGSSGSSGSGGKTVIVSTSTYHYGYGSTGFLGLPLWASILICVGSFLVLLFFIALIWSSVIESGRSKRDGNRFRFGHVLWTAFKVASGLWFWIWLFKCCCGKKRAKYAKIEEGRGAGGGQANSTWYGSAAPAAAPYDAGGTGYVSQMEGKYEPMGYAGASISPSPTPAPPPYVGGAADQSYYNPKEGPAPPAPRSPQPLSQVVYPPPAGDSAQPTPVPTQTSFAAPPPHPPTSAPPTATSPPPGPVPYAQPTYTVTPPAPGPPNVSATYVPTSDSGPAFY